ncbi:MAG: site-specific DNA-methyltransferase, partial [Flavobacteriaceae bacterium]|nr:site-specific DNA-methyltransferase [Flavobacteriaceae bacterium]
MKSMKLTDNEKRDVVKLIEEGKVLPEKYRFLLFDESKQVELTWNGKSDEVTNVVLPFQIIEQIDEPRNEEVKMAQGSFDFASGRQMTGWTNKLIWGDNKYILSSLKNGPMREEIEKEGGIKLIYIDPPFDVGADFSMDVEIGDGSYEKKPNVLEHIAYRDTWGLGTDSFLSMIYERLILMKDLLADDGTIFVHCDWRLNSSIRLILDEIFGKENFKNEILWYYRNKMGRNSKDFPKATDTLLFYSKSKNHIFNEIKIPREKPVKQSQRVWKDGKNMRARDENGNIIYEMSYDTTANNVWDIPFIASTSYERIGYPTQKPEVLLERIIKSVTSEGDIVSDFFSGSGTTAAVSEKLNRKWICSDLGKFAIHATRKRMIGIQRELKKEEKNWRAFEILNLGKYQRQHYIYDGKNERDEIKAREKKIKEKEFEKLILEAYGAVSIDGFSTIHGKKGSEFVSLGPINQPLSRNHVEEVISECVKNKITSVDILGFEYEMGLFPTIQEEAKSKGLRLSYKQIPMEVFDKRAVSKGEVIFHDVAYIEFKPHFDGNKLSVELTDFAVFYNENNLGVDESISNGKSKIVVENGQIVEKKKDKDGIISETILTKKWYDWIDYWSVDFDYESKPEIIKFETKDGKVEEEWTGNYVFENEWQSFRGKYKENRLEKLELKSSQREIASSKTKVAVKVVDIFGND